MSSRGVRRAEAIWQPLVILRATPPPPAPLFSQVLELVGTIPMQEVDSFQKTGQVYASQRRFGGSVGKDLFQKPPETDYFGCP